MAQAPLCGQLLNLDRFGAAVQLGLPSGFIDGQTRLYHELKNVFSFGEALGNWFVATTSFIQGCALSQIWLNFSATMWARLVRLRLPGVRTSGYVDDRSLRCETVYGLQLGLGATFDFDIATLQESHPKEFNL